MQNKTIAELEEQVKLFNATYGIGCKVDIKLDSGEIKAVTVSNKASILSTHSAVGWFEEISGCYSLDRVCDGTLVKDIDNEEYLKTELIKQFKENYNIPINRNSRYTYKFQFNQSNFNCIIRDGMVAITNGKIRLYRSVQPDVKWNEKQSSIEIDLSESEYEELRKLWSEPMEM